MKVNIVLMKNKKKILKMSPVLVQKPGLGSTAETAVISAIDGDVQLYSNRDGDSEAERPPAGGRLIPTPLAISDWLGTRSFRRPSGNEVIEAIVLLKQLILLFV